MIRKLFGLFTFVLIINSCEEIPSNLIEPQAVDYTILEINAPDFIVYNESNNTITTTLILRNGESVSEVWFDMNTSNGLETVSSNNRMVGTGSNARRVYTGEITIDENQLSGSYEFAYYVQDKFRTSDDNIRKVGVKIFEYRSEVENFPPVLNNLNLQAEVNRNVSFVFSVKCADPNGLSDVAKVFFKLKRPDGTIVYLDTENQIEEFPMFDNGDVTNAGDQIANDGIYSLRNSFGPTSQTGDWVFEFGARDKSGELSNIITQSINVK